MKKRTRNRRAAARALDENIVSPSSPTAAGRSTSSAEAVVDVDSRETAWTPGATTRRAASVREDRSVSPCDDRRNGRKHGAHRPRSDRRGRDSGPTSDDEADESSGESYSNSPTVQFRDKSVSYSTRVRCQSSPQLSRVSSSLRIPSYDGSGPLRTFVIQYKACKAYYQWSDSQAIAHLKIALSGRAAQILWQLPEQCTESQIFDSLTETFEGSESVDHYRQLLKNRKQARDENLESYFLDILKLSNLAFPGQQKSSLLTVMLKDLYLDNVHDMALKARLMENDYDSIFELHKRAIKLQTITQNLAYERKFARSLKMEESDADNDNKKIRLLESRLDKLVASLQDRQAVSSRDRLDSVPMAQQNTQPIMPRLLPNSVRTEATTAKNGKGRRCYRCNSEFHLAKQCDVNPPSGRADPWRPTRVSRLSNLGTHYYLPTTFTKGGQTFDSLVLIDSGSGVQIMPHTMLKWATSPLRQVKKRVYSASGDHIEIIGAATVRYIVDGIKMSSEFLFSPHISECIVGLPWLVENDATWHVAQGVLNIRGRQVRLVHGPDETRVRRIFAAEDVRIKPKTVTVIPVRMPLDVISSTDADWSTQAKTIGRSVILPRCLLSNRINGFIQAANPNDSTAFVRKDACLGTAMYNAPESNNNSDRITDCAYCKTLSVADAQDVGDNDYDTRSFVNKRHVSDSKSQRRVPYNLETLHEDRNVSHSYAFDNLSQQQQEMINVMLKTVDPDIDERYKEMIRDVLIKHIAAFATTEFDSGCFKGYQHRIQLRDPTASPSQCPSIRLPAAQQEIVQRHVEQLIAAGVLVPSENSKWSSNLLVVRKAPVVKCNSDGSPEIISQQYRVICDLRKVNSKVIPFTHDLGDKDSMIHSLAKASFTCRFDFKQSYYGVKIAPEDQHILTVRTARGNLKYTRMPYGYVESGSTYCYLLQKLIRQIDVPGAMAYVDDVILAIQDVAQGIENLNRFLSGVIEAGVKLNHTKTCLFASELDLLGWRIRRGTISITEKRSQDILKLQFPRSKRQLRSIVGTANFLSAHVPNFGMAIKPFQNLLRKSETRIVQTPQLEEAFQKLKTSLAESAELSIFRTDLPAHMYIDASLTAASAILGNQFPDGRFRATQYMSYVFSENERNFCVVRRELHALLLALKRFRYLLLGRKTVVFTDSQILANILTAKHLSPLLCRKIDLISSFHLEIRHIDGAKNLAADVLSRFVDPTFVHEERWKNHA
jgi:hypothetical protein